MRALRLVAVLASVPLLGAALGLALGGDFFALLPVLVLLAAAWALVVLQLASGHSGRAFMAYGRLRIAALRHRHPDAGGQQRLVGPAPRSSPDRPKLAWSHDGWAHADGHLVGLAALAEWFDVTAF